MLTRLSILGTGEKYHNKNLPAGKSQDQPLTIPTFLFLLLVVTFSHYSNTISMHFRRYLSGVFELVVSDKMVNI